MSRLTWTGTNASARKLEDDINSEDGGRYATVDVGDVWTMAGKPQAHVDTLSTAFNINPGDTIQKVDGVWEKVLDDDRPHFATNTEIDRHAQKQGVSWSDAWNYFRALGYDMSQAGSEY